MSSGFSTDGSLISVSAVVYPTAGVQELWFTLNERLIMAVLVYRNGLNPEIFLKWCDVKGLCRGVAARRHLKNLLRYFEKGRYVRELYAYNVASGRYSYIDGREREVLHLR